MVYRDDEDALLARVDALEEDKRRLEAELAKRDPPPPPPAPAPAPVPAPAPSPRARTVRTRTILIAVAAALVIALIALVLWLPISDNMTDKWHSVRYFAPDPKARWTTLLAAEPCLDGLAIDAYSITLVSPAHYDPVHPPAERPAIEASSAFGDLDRDCAPTLAAVAIDPAVPEEARAELAQVLAAGRRADRALAPLADYYGHQDYQDDGFARGPGLWRDAEPAFAAWRDAVDRARDLAMPLLDAELAALADARDPSTRADDLPYWRLHLGLAYRAIAAHAVDQLRPATAAGTPADRGAIADALVAPFAAFQGEVARAPLAIRRQLRDLFDLPTYVRGVDHVTESLYNVVQGDGDLLKDDGDDADLLP